MKKKVTPEKTANEWLELIQRAVLTKTDEVPLGFKTVQTISKEIGKSDCQTRRYLNQAIKKGLVESKIFRIETGQKIFPVPHFKIL